MHMPVYPNNFKSWFFCCAKAPGLKDRKWVHIGILAHFRSIQPRDFGAQKNQLLKLFGYKLWVTVQSTEISLFFRYPLATFVPLLERLVFQILVPKKESHPMEPLPA